MKKIVMFNYSEISLKKKNRKFFEEKVFSHIKKISDYYSLGKTFFMRGRFYIEISDDKNMEKALKKFEKIFGLQSVFLGFKCEKDLTHIIKAANSLIKNSDRTFKIKAKRSDKSFELNSMELNREIGAAVLSRHQDLQVDVHEPDVEIQVEIHKNFAFVIRKEVDCARGLPYGSSGKVVSLLSGGIDSPVATYLMMKRGCEIIPIHFHTPPYTGETLVEKIKMLAEILSEFAAYPFELHFINFTQIQIAVKKFAADKFTTILTRRFMLKIAEKIANEKGAQAIITGDALGQVASQTLENIYCISEAVKIPVLRPLISFDKSEIEQIAQKIGTYETSISEGIDCCHLFSPKHPETRGKLDMVLAEEKKVMENLNHEIPYEITKIKIDPFSRA